MKLARIRFAPILTLSLFTLAVPGCAFDDDVSADEESAPAEAEPEAANLGQVEQGLMNCSNSEGTYSTMAAIAVSAAQEMKRWQPSKDFAVVKIGTDEALGISATGKSRCADGKCAKTQALLDFQKNEANGKVTFPGNVKLNSAGLRSRLVAKFKEQATCEKQPDNHRAENCPVEEHTLTFVRSEKGGCDTNFFFQAKGATGQPLKYPAQLKNKLIWADQSNPYIGFQAAGDVISIDPTYGLNEDSSTSAGSCTAACAKVTTSNVAGQCCSCNAKTLQFVKAAWNAQTYVCQ
jgi:hypothetical protein